MTRTPILSRQRSASVTGSLKSVPSSSGSVAVGVGLGVGGTGSVGPPSTPKASPKSWTATLIFMAMEIRMIADMAELFSKDHTYSPRKKNVSGDRTAADTAGQGSQQRKPSDDSNSSSSGGIGGDCRSPLAPLTTTATPLPTRPPPPRYHHHHPHYHHHILPMDRGGGGGGRRSCPVTSTPSSFNNHDHDHQNNRPPPSSSSFSNSDVDHVNAFSASSYTSNSTGPISCSIELDSFRNPSAMSGTADEVRFGPSRDATEATTTTAAAPNGGRVAEVGIVLPIVPSLSAPGGGGGQDVMQNGGEGGGGGGGEGGGGGVDKSHAYSDEKTPLQQLEEIEVRENWSNKTDFLLSVIGYAVDLANVWRFPYLCYKNGGGAFLVPYFSVLMFGAMPVFFMEMCMGQFHRQGPITVWKMAPMFKGIGMASCYMAYIVAFYYNIIIGWSIFYLFSSFSSSPLPWTSCSNEWNSPRCWEGEEGDVNGTWLNSTVRKNDSVTSTLEFFERGVLRVHESSGLDNLGHVRWQLVLCTLLTFCLLYFCLWKGVKTTGKVVYLTATMPYIILTILLIRGVTLPGAGEGIKFFITPDLAKLADPGVWIDAAVQIFFSVGAGFGTHIAYASYNKFNNNCQR